MLCAVGSSTGVIPGSFLLQAILNETAGTNYSFRKCERSILKLYIPSYQQDGCEEDFRVCKK
jgi:hypothetical protein